MASEELILALPSLLEGLCKKYGYPTDINGLLSKFILPRRGFFLLFRNTLESCWHLHFLLADGLSIKLRLGKHQRRFALFVHDGWLYRAILPKCKFGCTPILTIESLVSVQPLAWQKQEEDVLHFSMGTKWTGRAIDMCYRPGLEPLSNPAHMMRHMSSLYIQTGSSELSQFLYKIADDPCGRMQWGPSPGTLSFPSVNTFLTRSYRPASPGVRYNRYVYVGMFHGYPLVQPYNTSSTGLTYAPFLARLLSIDTASGPFSPADFAIIGFQDCTWTESDFPMRVPEGAIVLSAGTFLL